MLRAISYKSISQYSDLFIGQFRLRHQEFIERQAYRVRTLDGLEFDEYDTLASVYLVYSEDDKTVLGCSRLTPLGYGCMLADHFAHLVDDPDRFGRPGVWEGTRFCIDRRLPADLRKHVCHHLPDGVSLTLDDEPATDAQGAGGVSDQINRHSGQLVGAAGVSALLALAAQPADGAGDTGAAWALRNALQQTQSQVGQLYVARQMNVQPTLSIRAGERVYLVLQTDLSVPAPAKGE